MTDAASLNGASPPRLLDQVRGTIRLKHYSLRTEQAYSDWIKRYIRFHGKYLRQGNAVGWIADAVGCDSATALARAFRASSGQSLAQCLKTVAWTLRIKC